jgi:prepilin-type N-terminal cleavage/methylation domain-containing protein
MKKIKRFKKLKHSRFRYFTMIEMLAVAAILAILAGLSFGAYSAVQKARANAKTEGNLNTLHAALQAFKTKYGYYPQTGDDKYVAVVVSKGLPTTKEESVSSSPKHISGKHLVFGADFVKNLSSEILKTALADGEINNQEVLIIPDGYKDPVKNKPTNIDKPISLIYYRCPGSVNKDSYDLFSAGADRAVELPSSGSDYKESEKENKDNIWPQNHKKQSNTK